MSDLRYPVAELRGDYLRAGFGLIVSLGPALAVPLDAPVNLLLVPAAVLFVIFGLRTWQRQNSRVVIDRKGISIFRTRRVSLAWTSVRSVRLSYFSTRTDRKGGWMQLTLTGQDPRPGSGPCKLRIDSALDGFEQVVRCTASAIRMNRLTVSAATRANFDALGIDLTDGAADLLPEELDGPAILQESR